MFAENSFVLQTSELTFARLNQINGKWVAWFYTKHIQKSFEKLREALSDINKEFVAWYRIARS